MFSPCRYLVSILLLTLATAAVAGAQSGRSEEPEMDSLSYKAVTYSVLIASKSRGKEFPSDLLDKLALEENLVGMRIEGDIENPTGMRLEFMFDDLASFLKWYRTDATRRLLASLKSVTSNVYTSLSQGYSGTYYPPFHYPGYGSDRDDTPLPYEDGYK